MAGESADRSARRMRDKATRLNEAAERWERGAEGERQTALALAALPPEEWTVFHDVPWPGRPRANIDHVAVGRGGIFVIDSKNWTGGIAVKDGVLRQNGRKRTAAVKAASAAASAVADLLPSPMPGAIHEVLCFVRDEPVVGIAESAIVCSTGNLTQMLETRAPVWTDWTRADVARRLGARMRERTPAQRAVAQPSIRRRRTNAMSLAPRLAGILAALSLLGVTFTHPELYEKFSDTFVGLVASNHDLPKEQPVEKPAEQEPRKRDHHQRSH